jgi:hypothetical protein
MYRMGFDILHLFHLQDFALFVHWNMVLVRLIKFAQLNFRFV